MQPRATGRWPMFTSGLTSGGAARASGRSGNVSERKRQPQRVLPPFRWRRRSICLGRQMAAVPLTVLAPSRALGLLRSRALSSRTAMGLFEERDV